MATKTNYGSPPPEDVTGEPHLAKNYSRPIRYDFHDRGLYSIVENSVICRPTNYVYVSTALKHFVNLSV